MTLDKDPHEERQQETKRGKRDIIFLVLGVILGGMFSVLANLWSSYFIEWLKTTYNPTDWSFALSASTAMIISIVILLFVYSFKLLKK